MNPALGGFYWKVTPSENGDGDEGIGDQSKVTQVYYPVFQNTVYPAYACSSIKFTEAKITINTGTRQRMQG